MMRCRFDRRQWDAEDAEHAADAMTNGNTIRNSHRGRAEECAPQADCDHCDDVVGAEHRMCEAGEKAAGSLAGVGKAGEANARVIATAATRLGALTLPHSPSKTGVNALMAGRLGARSAPGWGSCCDPPKDPHPPPLPSRGRGAHGARGTPMTDPTPPFFCSAMATNVRRISVIPLQPLLGLV